MKLQIPVICLCICILFCAPLYAQNHSSVPLGSQVYYILEQAEIKGLCSPLPGVRPYTQSVVIAAVNEILRSDNAHKLRETERAILEQYRDTFSKPKQGIDWYRGGYYAENAAGKENAPLSMNIGLTADIEGSAGLYPDDNYFGMETWLGLHLNGDLGSHVSYGFIFEVGLIKAPRNKLGIYNIYYDGFPNEADTTSEYANKEIVVYSEPLTHFPYTYKKPWDGSVFFFNSLSDYNPWPNAIAGGYSLPAEVTASFLENKLIARVGRISREWGSTSFGSSLAFNQMARPFLGIEAEFNPVSWFGIASITGALEYHNISGIKVSSTPFQNMFSQTMLQFRYKNYLFFDIIDTVVYPKRFEFGYVAPIISNFMYQNNIGDFDNMAMTFNLKAQYPGVGNMWVSFFIDEMKLTADLRTLDRQMIAIQGGTNIALPFLAFSSIKLSYTKINPYCYTHNRNYNPWYGSNRMETAYVNNGVSLGYYLPPNSDEILARFQTMPVKNLVTHLQYQMIRHGADFGSGAVDGSNLLSELDPKGRDSKAVLKRFFLHDGAYQWLHIGKLGAEWTLSKAPLAFYGEAGLAHSSFTNTKQPANSGKSHSYRKIDTSEYPKSTGFVVELGIKVFPQP